MYCSVPTMVPSALNRLLSSVATAARSRGSGCGGRGGGYVLGGCGRSDPRAPRPIPLAHPARATGRQDLVRAQPCASAKRLFEGIISSPSPPPASPLQQLVPEHRPPAE